MTMRKPKILLWDIETGYNLVRVHTLAQPGKYIPFTQLESERYVICASFKELGQKRVKSLSLLDDPAQFAADPAYDEALVAAIYEELSTADAVIAHNGDRFDIRRFNARAVYWGLPPLPPLVQIDTLKIARKHFDFNSNRLDYLAQHLGVGEKLKFDRDIWKDVFHGDAAALKQMVKYNKRDVHLLEAVYNKLAPYAKAQLNRGLFTDEERVCPSCGSLHVQSRGLIRTVARVYPRFQCQACGHWFRGVNSVAKTGVK